VVTTAADLVTCDYCHANVPADGTFQPLRGGPVHRCRDVPSCERRALRAYDPTILSSEDLPRPPVATAPPGVACEICGASRAAVYERIPRSGQWFCRDRAECDRAVAMDMTPAREDFADFTITPAEMRATVAAAGAVIAAERPAASHAESAEHARADRSYSLAAAGRRDR
jgi:hypothetical protein